MKAQKFTKTLTATAILSLALCESALSQYETDCPANSSEGSLCWKCGDTCIAKLETTGKMTISGTGDMYNYTTSSWQHSTYDKPYQPWANKNNLIKSVVIESGITKIGDEAFRGASNLQTLDWSKAVNLTDIGTGSFRGTAINHEVIIPPNVTSFSQTFAFTNVPIVSCPLTLNCDPRYLGEWNNPLQGSVRKYGQEGNHYIFYDSENNIIGRFNLDKSKEYDEDENIIAEYDRSGNKTTSYNYSASGQLLSANTYDLEGNINGSYTYDAGGNLVSAYQNGKAVYLRKRYTIPEADAATQGKGPFRLDITW